MAAGTVVTLVSLPVYAAFYRWHGAMGLAVASDVGIALQTVTVAVLLHKRRMVALASGAAVWVVFEWLGAMLGHLLWSHAPVPIRWVDLAILVAGTLLWLVVTLWVLERSEERRVGKECRSRW